MISKNKIKYIRSLELKKNRNKEGKIKMLDAYTRITPWKTLQFTIGQERVPFTIDAHRSPHQQYFANRSFIAKQVGNVRDVGAENLGCKSLILGKDGMDWDKIAEILFAGDRIAEVKRTTKETDIYIKVNLDGSGKCDISTGLGFFDHMLEQIGKHGMMDLTIHTKGDLYVDEHHTIEDTGIALGECLLQALGDKRGIERYGYCLPMDDCLCQVALDFGGRPWLIWDAEFHREKVGEMVRMDGR